MREVDEGELMRRRNKERGAMVGSALAHIPGIGRLTARCHSEGDWRDLQRFPLRYENITSYACTITQERVRVERSACG